MTGLLRRLGLSCLAAASLALASMPVQAADFVRDVHVGDPGVCANARVLGTIDSKFAYQVRNVPNLPQVGIVQFADMRETRFQPQGPDRPIERRYCQARVHLTDGVARDVWYLIEHPMGFVGIGANVEFCVAGFDRWNVYGGHCRVLR